MELCDPHLFSVKRALRYRGLDQIRCRDSREQEYFLTQLSGSGSSHAFKILDVLIFAQWMICVHALETNPKYVFADGTCPLCAAAGDRASQWIESVTDYLAVRCNESFSAAA